ncbi:MAG TPA: hypothetical protein VJO32_08865, partial [Ktedonobacteraceae bacterium]|nr:hypothetical protein [Ktedonobacteraceae bacterium]
MAEKSEQADMHDAMNGNEAPEVEQEEHSSIPGNAGAAAQETPFRPLTRIERRNLWLRDYSEQDLALQMWARLVEQQDLEIEMMLQIHGLLVFGVMV